MSRSAVRGILTALVIVIVVVGAAGGLAWWKISSLKKTLIADLEKSLGASVVAFGRFFPQLGGVIPLHMPICRWHMRIWHVKYSWLESAYLNAWL